MAHKHTLVILTLSCVLIVGLFAWVVQSTKEANTLIGSYLALWFIIGGAIANLIDRVRLGAVVDFIDFGFWPVFNLADSAITCGAIALIHSLFREKGGS